MALFLAALEFTFHALASAHLPMSSTSKTSRFHSTGGLPSGARTTTRLSFGTTLPRAGSRAGAVSTSSSTNARARKQTVWYTPPTSKSAYTPISTHHHALFVHSSWGAADLTKNALLAVPSAH